MSFQRIACVASDSPKAQEGLASLRAKYDFVDWRDADVLVIVGGDGFMLRALHETIGRNIPLYGMNLGSVGFLLNDYAEENLRERMDQATPERLFPLKMTARNAKGEESTALGFNEVSLMRETHQTAHLRIHVDKRTAMEELMCDGLLVSTPAGSTAYNLSARGPILPVGSNLLALTPISPFRPRRWHGALLPNESVFEFEVLDHESRRVSATADFTEVRNVVSVKVVQDRSAGVDVLFDPENTLQDRVFGEQFTP